MKINIQEFLDHCGITDEKIFPGKKLVRKLRQPGEFKSHCVILDWHHTDQLHIEIKAGLSGRTLANADLKKYPVCFQAPTYIDIKTNISNDDACDDDEEEQGSSGRASGGGGGRKLKKSLQGEMVSAFSTVMEGKVPELGTIKKMVVMGKEIGKDAYAQVMEKLAEQIRQTKIIATDLLAEAGKFITKYSPPAFMKPTGDEDKPYKYDRMKNEPMFGRPLMG
ncbi:MAG TPA: hypothetical protein VGD95_08615 [Micavibrio sp.]